ncbi:MAG TPA: hypothetical protein VGE08_09535 [Steroidobacter sp.]|uniref:hypothetical protein n=1 Tax=Steroidobacter sp. TaxID=1978227 RepID=UPI002EDB5A8E
MKVVICLIAAFLFVISSAVPADDVSAGSEVANFLQMAATKAEAVNERFGLSSRKGGAARCCKVCTKGKPCGDTCIAQDKICHVGSGCAC